MAISGGQIKRRGVGPRLIRFLLAIKFCLALSDEAQNQCRQKGERHHYQGYVQSGCSSMVSYSVQLRLNSSPVPPNHCASWTSDAATRLINQIL